jgi:hypothetical protein
MESPALRHLGNSDFVLSSMIGIQGSGVHFVQLRQILRCLVSASKVHDLGGDHNQKKAYLLNTSPPLCNGASYISWTLETWELLLVYKGSRRCSCISSEKIL